MPFSDAKFQQLVADIHGCNGEIRAPVIAFIAFKLGALLADSTWNVVGERISESKSGTGASYGEFLDLAIRARGTTILAAADGEDEEAAGDDDDPARANAMWIRISHDMDVRFCLLA